jgi:hypothetical protein
MTETDQPIQNASPNVLTSQIEVLIVETERLGIQADTAEVQERFLQPLLQETQPVPQEGQPMLQEVQPVEPSQTLSQDTASSHSSIQVPTKRDHDQHSPEVAQTIKCSPVQQSQSERKELSIRSRDYQLNCD